MKEQAGGGCVIGCFSVAVTNTFEQGNLQKKEFAWADGSRGIRVYQGEVAGVATGVAS